MALRINSLAAARALLGKRTAKQLDAAELPEDEPSNSIDTWRTKPFRGNLRFGPEDKIQIEILEYLRQSEILEADAVVFHVPSAAKRSRVVWAWLRVLGFFAGFPDLIILFPKGRVGFIEVKRDRRESSITGAQKRFRAWCQRTETPYVVATCSTDVHNWLTEIESVS